MSIADYLRRSEQALADTRAQGSLGAVDRAVDLIVANLKDGKPLLVCGNGGSAADALHIAGELVGRFLRDRKAINCIALSANPAIITAWANDRSYDTIFARQIEAHGADGAVLLGISTSGNSNNVVAGFRTARELGIGTIALTGQGGGQLASVTDILIDVPSSSTPLIQQVHLCLYHYLCEQIERRLA